MDSAALARSIEFDCLILDIGDEPVADLALPDYFNHLPSNLSVPKTFSYFVEEEQSARPHETLLQDREYHFLTISSLRPIDLLAGITQTLTVFLDTSLPSFIGKSGLRRTILLL